MATRMLPMAGADVSSRFLTYVLRHHPEAIGVSLDPNGWIAVDDLLVALAAYGRPMERATLERIVATSDKRRFEVHNGRIRAAQGHSVPVDLDLPPLAPPPVLYHGTVARFVDSILARGLDRGRRRLVHLSPDVATARVVGGRRGQPIILRIDAAGAHAAGLLFFRAANGVWLTEHVPPLWITKLSSDPDG